MYNHSFIWNQYLLPKKLSAFDDCILYMYNLVNEYKEFMVEEMVYYIIPFQINIEEVNTVTTAENG